MQVNSFRPEELVKLAKGISSIKRQAILLKIADIFATCPNAFSKIELNCLGEILSGIAETVDSGSRQKLSDLLSNQPHVPHPLVLQLACDDIAVAEPMLRKSVVLTNKDLVVVVNQESQAHLYAIAQRNNIPTVVTDALIEAGDHSVIVKLVENAGASISKNGFEILIGHAETTLALHRPLALREELPLELLNSMFFFVSGKLQKKIVERNQTASKKEIKAAVARSSRLFRRQRRSFSSIEIQTELNFDELEQKKLLNQKALVHFLRDRNISNFLVAFARLASLDIETVRLILLDKRSDALALVCRALDFDSETFSALLSFDFSDNKFNFNRSYVKRVELYNEMMRESARRTLRFWRTRQKATSDEEFAKPLRSRPSAA